MAADAPPSRSTLADAGAARLPPDSTDGGASSADASNASPPFGRDAGAQVELDAGNASLPVDGEQGGDSEAQPSADAAPPQLRCAPNEVDSLLGSCFFLLSTPAQWLTSRSACQARGADWDLASIRSPVANRVLSEMLPDESWVGGSDAAMEATWQWVLDGSVFWQGDGAGAAVGGAFTNFSQGEPNGEEGSACLRVRPSGTWGDLECDELLPAVCEGPPSSS